MDLEIAKPKQIDKEDSYRYSDNYQVGGKYDGTRMILISDGKEIKLFNKRGKEKTKLYPEIEKLDLPEMVLDGEMIIKDEENPHGNFTKLQRRDTGSWTFKKKLLYKKYKATFVAFDVLEWKGENYRSVPLRDRRKKLEEITEDLGDRIESSVVFDDISSGWVWAVGEEDGIEKEGLVIKDKETEYPKGRTEKWLKIKNTKDVIRKAKTYEEHSKGIRIETVEEDQGVTVNGAKAEEVKQQIEEKGEVEIEITCLEEKEDTMRQPVFKRLVK